MLKRAVSPTKERFILILLLVIFITKGTLLAFIQPPFKNEDELAHFGYIEALARTGSWYLFEGNTTSQEAVDALQFYLKSPNKAEALDAIHQGKFTPLRLQSSNRYNATAYQPPLYYWLSSWLYRALHPLDVFSLMLVFRLLSLIISAVTVALSYHLARLLFKDPLARLILVCFLVFQPMFALQSASVSIHPFVNLLSTLTFLLLLKNHLRHWPRPTTLALLALLPLSLLTQQILVLHVPLIALTLLIDLIQKQITRRHALLISLGFALTLTLIIPQSLRRHQNTRYFDHASSHPNPEVTPLNYALTAPSRLINEYFTGFFDQRRAQTQYTVAGRYLTLIRIITAAAILGLVAAIFRPKSLFAPLKYWSLISLLALITHLIFHTIFDYLQLVYSSNEYFKGRYLFPLIVPIFTLYVLGLYQLFGRTRHWPTVVLLSTTLMFLAQWSALIWVSVNAVI
jgi:4-amino-4-deoxy-L-arabinose transferase-like glycosyltransferase